jgi:hypothetical protein
MSKTGIGFLTFAQNNSNTDYLRLAYAQACNFKSIHTGMKYAVIVDKQTATCLTPSCLDVFDYVIELEHDYNKENSEWKLANECQVFTLTPFKETIKIESDLLVTRPIDHWLTAFRLKEVVLSTGCKNYRQQLSDKRTYRKFFDDNELPDIYNGLMYFRFSQFAQQFFYTAKQILDNWDYLKNQILKNCREDTPSTDVLYAITAKTLGVENCTLPSMEFINFVHMKPSIQNWSDIGDWQKMTTTEQDENMIRIHNLNQYDPIHYYEKSFITDERLQHYEQQYRRSGSIRNN